MFVVICEAMKILLFAAALLMLCASTTSATQLLGLIYPQAGMNRLLSSIESSTGVAKPIADWSHFGSPLPFGSSLSVRDHKIDLVHEGDAIVIWDSY